MKNRVIFGLIALAIAIALLYFHGWVILGGVFILAIISEYEIIKAFRGQDSEMIAPICYGYTVLLLPTYYFFGVTGVLSLQVFAVMLIFMMAVVFNKHYSFGSAVSSIFNLFYPQMFYLFFYMIILAKNGDGVWDIELSRLILLVGAAGAVGTDTFAFFFGYFLGKTKLCPSISPKKTVEGAVGGLLGGVVGVLLMAVIFDHGRVHLVEYFVFSLVISAISQIGDLAASLVKRHFGIKDYGNLIPGHGGILDRVDSVLFVLPVVYLFYHLYLGLI